MKSMFLLLLGWMGVLVANGQEWTKEPVSDLDGKGWLAGLHVDGLVMHSVAADANLISDEGLGKSDVQQSLLYRRGETWSSYPPDSTWRIRIGGKEQMAIGTWSAVENSNFVVFSLIDDAFGYPAGSLVEARCNGTAVDSVKLVLLAQDGERHIHPSLSDDGGQIVFSSNRDGGTGKFDLYYLNRLADGWSEPVSLGAEVNSSSNEVFPTWKGDRVHFSSDRDGGAGGLDVYSSSRSMQYAATERLPFPINSAGDDFQLIWLDDENAFLSTNRTGADGVLRIRRSRTSLYAENLRAELICAGSPIINAKVSLRNALGELVLSDVTGANGSFDIGQLELRRSYRAVFEGAPEAVLQQSLLYIVNAEGKRIMVFAPDREGRFVFELMPPNDADQLGFEENKDESRLLNVGVEGRLIGENAIDSGEVIFVEDGKGRVTALTYTTEGGRFRFDNLSPELQYTFKFDEDSQVMKMVIYDRGEEIELEVTDGKVVYTRVEADEAIRLNDERNNPIAIRSDDLFVIRKVYYAFNSAELNADAQSELDRLATLLKNNPGLRASLTSHTDSRGTDAFNLELSNRRAAGCVAYLTAQGISANRLQAKGMGESKLLNRCTDEVECDEQDHAVNRRTELVLIAPVKGK